MDPAELDPTDAARWVAALRAAYARSLEEGGACWNRAEAAVAAGTVPASALAQAALLALETMGPADPTSLGMTACEALRVHADRNELERLRAVRPGLPARKGLRDWRVEASRAIDVIQARVSGTCTCAAEAARGAPVYGEQWAVDSERVDTDEYCVHTTVRCTRCQSRWSVRRDDSYHYPTFAWTKG
jgi:hypothetical protein